MLLALWPIINALLNGATLAVALRALTLDQLVAIGVAAAKALPAEIEITRALLQRVAPAFERLLNSGGNEIDAVALHRWIAQNAQATITQYPDNAEA